MAAADRELHRAGVKTYVGFAEGARFVVALFADEPELLALIEADRLGQLRTGPPAPSRRGTWPSRARGLRPDRHRLAGGEPARVHPGCLGIEQVVAYSRNEERLRGVLRSPRLRAGEYNRDAAEQDVVVDDHEPRDPVLRGEWLQPGALVCAAGANRVEARELDNAVLERASFVCCDSFDQPRIERAISSSGRPSGVLDWLEVHELAEVVAGETAGRQADDDIAVFKSLGIAAEDVAVAALVYDRARERGLGVELGDFAEEVEQQAVVPVAVGAALVLPHHPDPLEPTLRGPDRPLVGDGGVDRDDGGRAPRRARARVRTVSAPSPWPWRGREEEVDVRVTVVGLGLLADLSEPDRLSVELDDEGDRFLR